MRDSARKTRVIKQTTSVSFNEKTARNGAREEKHLGELSLSLYLRCASVRHICLKAACVCLSHTRKHTLSTLLWLVWRTVRAQCSVCVFDLRPFSLSAMLEGFCWSFQMDVPHTFTFKCGQTMDDYCWYKSKFNENRERDIIFITIKKNWQWTNYLS